jgi:hypothetical protein
MRLDLREIHQGDPDYPAGLTATLGPTAPTHLALAGNPDVLGRDKLALFCSTRCPGDLILKAYDLAKRRNEFVAAIADRVCFIHVSSGGGLEALRNRVRQAKKPVIEPWMSVEVV